MKVLLNKRHSRIKIVSFFGGVFAILFITSLIPALYFFTSDEVTTYGLVVRSFLIALTPVLFLPVIYWISQKKPIFKDWKNTLLHIVLSLTFSLIFLVIYLVMILFILEGAFFLGMEYNDIESVLVRQFFSIGSILFFTYWGLVVLLGLDQYYEELGNIKQKSNEIQSQLELATLSSLRAQLKPHFLFNTLSMVDQMIATNPSTAAKMVDRLEKLLKTTFDRTGSESCTLEEEIDFIKKYLAIETHRFHDRLKVEYFISPVTKKINVPRYLLQPLVENALVHGAGRTMKECTITIKSEMSKGRLFIMIRDDGPGVRRKINQTEKGIGLKNVRARLRLYYGKGVQLKTNSVKNNGFISEISIPYKYLATNISETKTKPHKITYK